METVSCGVDDPRGKLSFDRSAKELAPCKDKDFSFEIVLAEGGNAVGVFEIKKDGNVVRRNTSKPFPVSALSKTKMDVNKQNCNVTLKKHDASINLKEYF